MTVTVTVTVTVIVTVTVTVNVTATNIITGTPILGWVYNSYFTGGDSSMWTSINSGFSTVTTQGLTDLGTCVYVYV